jgi:ribulose-phosphate 3-epimerase
MTRPFPLPSGRAEFVPSVLSADFSCLKASLAPVRGLCRSVQVDVMDGHFVPNISFGPGIVSAVIKACGLPVDAHLMVERPLDFVDAFAKAGSGLITVHAEAAGAAAAVKRIKALGLKAGLALRPRTPFSKIRRLLPSLDLVLVMTVEPGFGGQAFMADMLPKVLEVRKALDLSGRKAWLQVDGGIAADTAPLAAAAGADSLVMGSALFKAPRPAAYLKALRRNL